MIRVHSRQEALDEAHFGLLTPEEESTVCGAYHGDMTPLWTPKRSDGSGHDGYGTPDSGDPAGGTATGFGDDHGTDGDGEGGHVGQADDGYAVDGSGIGNGIYGSVFHAPRFVITIRADTHGAEVLE
jgi:hypothetical protein